MSDKELSLQTIERSENLVKQARLMIKNGSKVPSTIKEDLARAAVLLLTVAKDVENSNNFQEQKRHKKSREIYLQPVNDEGNLSEDQQKAIKQGPTSTHVWRSHWDARENRLDYIRTCLDRRARIEVRSVASEKKFQVTLFKGERISESVLLPAWNKLGVKRFIDYDSKIKVPWKQIQSGTPWIEDIEISPYHIEKTWVPQNVILFPKGREPALLKNQ